MATGNLNIVFLIRSIEIWRKKNNVNHYFYGSLEEHIKEN